MLLEIDDTKTISDLQDRFSLCFPNLKIELCRKKHNWEEYCAASEIYPAHMPIGKIRKIHQPGVLDIKSTYKVGEVEKALQETFGLNAQIYFRSGDKWVQTGKADNYTIGALQQAAYREYSVLL